MKLYFSDYGQVYKDVLSKLLDGSVSLYPLTTSIQELTSAAKEAEDEAKVKSLTFVRYSYIVNINEFPI